MNFKRVPAAALAAVLAVSLFPAALADERPEGWSPADGARGPMLISPNPDAGDIALPIGDLPVDDGTYTEPMIPEYVGPELGEDADGLIAPLDMPQVEIPAPNGGYSTQISVNGTPVESFDFDHEIPGWGSQSVTWQVKELDTVPAGYIPLRAVIQADGGSAYWDSYEYSSSFYYEFGTIVANFNDMSVSVNDQVVEGAQALLLNGVTYVPVSVLEKLEGVTVANNSTGAGESYEITTPNGTPLLKLASAIMESAGMGRGMKSTPAELEEIYGESMGFKAEYMTEGVAFLPMMISPDTLVLGKMADGAEEALRESLEAFRKSQEETFTWYLPQNLPKTQNAKFVTNGEWFLFLIGENADEAVKIFEAGVAELG